MNFSSEDQVLQFLDEISSKFPRAIMPQIIQLEFATGDNFTSRILAFLQSFLRKGRTCSCPECVNICIGVPPLFHTIRHLYRSESKVQSKLVILCSHLRPRQSNDWSTTLKRIWVNPIHLTKPVKKRVSNILIAELSRVDWITCCSCMGEAFQGTTPGLFWSLWGCLESYIWGNRAYSYVNRVVYGESQNFEGYIEFQAVNLISNSTSGVTKKPLKRWTMRGHLIPQIDISTPSAWNTSFVQAT